MCHTNLAAFSRETFKIRANDFPFPTVEIKCKTCGRYGRYSKERFCEIVGAHTRLPDALAKLASDCEKYDPTQIYLKSNCQLVYPQLAAMGQKNDKAK